MKKMLQLIFLFTMFFVMPIFGYAQKVESNLSSTDGIIDKFAIGQININNVGYTRYSNASGTGKPAVLFNGRIVNNYVRDVELEITLKIHDKNKKVFDKRTVILDIPAKDDIVYSQYVFGDEIDGTLDDIAFYSLEADLLSDVAILEKGQSDKYYLENYEIVVNVSESNIYSVKESFAAVFANNISPLSLGIPFRHKYTREDGSKVNKRAVISNIVVEDYHKLSIEKGIRQINIGKEDKANDKKNYQITYNYNVGQDVLDGKDEFVFYLVNNLSVKSDGFEFRIVMPKEFDESKISFIDANGIKLENIDYSVFNNTIMGKVKDVINPGTSYAIRIELDDNYFVDCSNNISQISMLSFLIPILFVMIAIIIMNISKKNDKKVTFKNVYFNEKINSLELGYLYSGKIKDNDIASLLFCLANKGYIDIVKNKKSYTIVKKREYTEDDRVEMAFMKELFFAKDEVTKKELLSSLTDMKAAITIKLDNKNKRKRKIFMKKILNYKLLFWFMICFIIVLNTINILIEYQPNAIVINSILSIIGYVILLNSLLSEGKVIEKILYSLVALILIVSPIVLTSYEAYVQDMIYTIIYVIGIVSMLIIAAISSTMRDRTKYGNKMLNKINAYKIYLAECSNGTIEKELRLNKNCLYEVLPYALVLGVSDRWISKFYGKKLSKPTWYITDEKFNINVFYLDVRNVYSDIFIALNNNEEESNQ